MKTQLGGVVFSGQFVVAGLERLDVALAVLSFTWPSGPPIDSLTAFDNKIDDVQTVLRAACNVSVLADNLPFTVEPSVIWSQHLALPPPPGFVGDEVELVTVLHGLSDLNFGGNVCRSGVVPCLVWQVDPNEGIDKFYLL
jgi:hypothetical protein